MKKIENFYLEDPHLQQPMKHYLKGDFHLWADKELVEFGKSGKSMNVPFIPDREGQPRLIKYNITALVNKSQIF
jgi:acyl-CoA dehydrogenase